MDRLSSMHSPEEGVPATSAAAAHTFKQMARNLLGSIGRTVRSGMAAAKRSSP